MKCDDCLNLLEEYIDGEAIPRDAEQVSAHLITCARCAHEFERLTAELEIYARYDRELELWPTIWNAIAARTLAEERASDSTPRSNSLAWLTSLFAGPRLGFAFSGAMAVLILAVVIGVTYLRMHQRTSHETIAKVETLGSKSPGADIKLSSDNGPAIKPITAASETHLKVSSKSNLRVSRKSRGADQEDVLFRDVADTDIEDKDTANHIEQAENLLRSIRNLQLSDDNDDEVDVSYEKAMSRRLLNENVVLRRDAEMAGKFPAKSLLGDLEPFLIDIANLPDKTTPNELRAIKERVQKTEIVAALRSY